MTPDELARAFWAITHDRLPLRAWRDYLYVSPEAKPEIGLYFSGEVLAREVVRVDPRLRGVEMRLEMACRP